MSESRPLGYTAPRGRVMLGWWHPQGKKMKAIGRRQIISAAVRQVKAGHPFKGILILIWLPLPLSWSRARLAYVKARHAKTSNS